MTKSGMPFRLRNTLLVIRKSQVNHHSLASRRKSSSSTSNSHRLPADTNLPGPHLPRIARRPQIRMPHHRRPIHIDVQATGRIQRPTIAPRHQQRRNRIARLGIRTPNPTRTRRIADVVILRRVAVAAEEQDVGAVDERQARRLDQGPVGIVAVEDLHGVADGRDAVGGELLEHDGRGDDGVDAVAAVAAVPDVVAVDLVDDVEGAVRVAEAGGVDGAALAADIKTVMLVWSR